MVTDFMNSIMCYSTKTGYITPQVFIVQSVHSPRVYAAVAELCARTYVDTGYYYIHTYIYKHASEIRHLIRNSTHPSHTHIHTHTHTHTQLLILEA